MNTPYIFPYQKDEQNYYLGALQGSELSIESVKRRDFPRHLVSSHINFLINRGVVKDASCFYSGLQCWLPGFDTNNTKVDVSLCMSKDHASSIKIATILGLKEKAKRSHNIVPCASYLNRNMGHTPLALKLFYKKELAKIDFDRSSINRGALSLITQEITRIQQSLMYQGLFVWQPWTYTNSQEKEYALEVFEKMIDVDRQFLKINKLKEAFTWLEAYDTAWLKGVQEQLERVKRKDYHETEVKQTFVKNKKINLN